jgi:hypothetical protein
MTIARKIAVAAAAGAVGLGLVGVAAPAHAKRDITWGYSVPVTDPAPTPAPVVTTGPAVTIKR